MCVFTYKVRGDVLAVCLRARTHVSSTISTASPTVILKPEWTCIPCTYGCQSTKTSTATADWYVDEFDKFSKTFIGSFWKLTDKCIFVCYCEGGGRVMRNLLTVIVHFSGDFLLCFFLNLFLFIEDYYLTI